MKRPLRLLAAAALLICLAGGCGSPVPEDTEAPPAETPEPTVQPSITPPPTPVPTEEAQPDPGTVDYRSFPPPAELERVEALPDLFTNLAGEAVTTQDEFDARLEEIRALYQYYMYGFRPDTSAEEISYSLDGSLLTVTVEQDGVSASFTAGVLLPDPAKTPAPEGGWPVLIELSFIFGGEYIPQPTHQYAAENGYAVIAFDVLAVAADDLSRTGAFYDLYPYGAGVEEQAGVLAAWSWGASKIVDCLELGLAEETGASEDNTIVAGVSRWGKAAAAAGAFDERIRVTMPVCTGAGGMALFRYPSAGNVYDYSSIGGPAAYTMGSNQPLSSLMSETERQWFNDVFLEFDDPARLPFDQHFLAALCSTNNRHLFIVASYQNEDWTNPPAMYGAYLAGRKAFEFAGNPDNIAVAFHPEWHLITQGDLERLIAYCNYHFYGIEAPFNLDDLKTTLYGSVAANRYPELYALTGLD
ncbi:MAG: hypothetical protein FWG93_01060 [Oscillospiraceae bacterium]|nr:hypothetical protein [Oscillospiraceae bacterium]